MDGHLWSIVYIIGGMLVLVVFIPWLGAFIHHNF